MIAYRPEIDGLRAVAVIAVLLFHVGISAVQGGFAGVDIFFVISGYLITSIIADQLRAGAFTFREFYERRARRILPALTAVCATSLVVFYYVFFLDDYVELSQSVIATMLFASNIFFWKATGYFATDVDQKPLLHTWSLGIEEQFYIFLPLVLFVAWRFLPNRAWIVVAVLAGLSLLTAEIGIRHEPDAAFYLLPFRFWELALGSLLALVQLPVPKAQNADNYIATGGLLLILASILTLSDGSGFPGIAALMPCAGAAMIIYSGARSPWIQRILGASTVVLVGRMSYSLYLWHWPILALVHYRFEGQLGEIGKLLIVSSSIIVSYLSWRFIETPFRNRNFLSRKTIFALSAVSIVTLTSASLVILHNNGFPARFPAKAFEIEKAAEDRPAFKYESCMEGKSEKCEFGDISIAKIEAVIWGDSHAAAFAPVLDDLFKGRGIKGVAQLKSSCPGFAGDYKWNVRDFGTCQDFNKKVFDWIIAHPSIKHVFLAARWQPVARKFAEDRKEAEIKFYEAIKETARLLEDQGRRVYFIAPMPEPEFDVPRCLTRQALFGAESFACTPPPLDEFLKRQATALAAFDRLKLQYPVFFPHEILCHENTCEVSRDDTILYFDNDHLSTKGAVLISPDVAVWFDNAGKESR